MHDIRYIGIVNCRCLVEVDGVQIALASNTLQIPYGDVESLRAYLVKLEDRLSSGASLADLRSVLGGTNLLRILETLYHDQTIKAWMEFLVHNSECVGVKTFRAFFGYVHNCRQCPSSFAEEIYLLGAAFRKEQNIKARELAKEDAANIKIKKAKYDWAVAFTATVSALENQCRAAKKDWCIERKNIVSNVAVYSVNDIEIEICLSGRPEFRYAYYVADFLVELKETLEKNDYDTLAALVKRSGGKAALEIMGSLFHDLSIQFFVGEFWNRARDNRVAPQPSKFLKSVFGGTRFAKTALGDELLNVLESEIPPIESYLVLSSDQEIHTDKSTWVLYYYHLDRMSKITIQFPANQPLRKEIQTYLLYVAEPYINSKKPYAEKLRTVSCRILTFLDAVGNRKIASALDISIWEIRFAIITMVQQRELSLSTVRNVLLETRGFLAFLDPDKAHKVIPSSLIPPQTLNPTLPLDPTIFSMIKNFKTEIPTHFWLVFRILEETGARLNSVVSLTVEDCVHIGDRWTVRIYNYKQADRNALAGAPNTITHWISDELGEELNKFIAETKELRAQLSIPYIFVYKNTIYRNNSERKPFVVNGDAYSEFFKKLCREKQITNSEGIVQPPSARNIRSEVGRSIFAAGASADAVSRKLGNTSEVAARHYNREYPLDEAMRRRALYAETIDPKLGVHKAPKTENIVHLNTPMYGQCGGAEDCGNLNRCKHCPERIVERKGGR